MAKATKTIRQSLNYQPQHGEYFAANQALFNRVVAFYFDCIQAHEGVLDLKNKEALTALEVLTHATEKNPLPAMPLSAIAEAVPTYFRRGAINAANWIGPFFLRLSQWKVAGTQREGQSPAPERDEEENSLNADPFLPRSWNKSVPLYAGQWKERTGSSILLKVWTGTCWSWVKVRTLGATSRRFRVGSPSLVRKGKQWWLHTPIEKTFSSPAKIAEQITTTDTRICAIDLNLGEHLAVCTVQTVEGTILATRFIGGGREIAGFRKKHLGRIARNRSQTGIIAENEQDNADLWRKIRNTDEHIAHLVSARIIQFACEQGAILVFEHLGNLKPEKGKYSHRGNSKRAFWMKGRIFNFAKYKAWNLGIITSRVNPRNTSRECARCHSLIVRYAQGQPVEGYTPGTPLCLCPAVSMRGNADRNASLIIGQRLIVRASEPFKEKPHAPMRRAGRVEKSTGVGLLPGSQTQKGTIYLLMPGMETTTAWHRARRNALDG